MSTDASRRSSTVPFIGNFQVGLLVFVALVSTLILYLQTAAPSVLSGDSGEFQFAAPLLGIPHPTGYPLYILASKLATMLIPFGDIAHRVTLVSSIAGSCTIAILALFTLHTTKSLLAALIAAFALALAPGMWNAATIAEVYALHMLFIALLAWTLHLAHAQKHTTTKHDSIPTQDAMPPPSAAQTHTEQRIHAHTATFLCIAACITGLGISHHGSFAFIAAPLFLIYGIGLLRHIKPTQSLPETENIPTTFVIKQTNMRIRLRPARLRATSPILRIALCGLLGLTPWLFVLVQYIRLGPFNGLDHGLHPFQPLQQADQITYFWGAPTTWVEALGHLFGGVMHEGGVFRNGQHPESASIGTLAQALWQRLRFEFGPLGILLGLFGCFTLLYRSPRLWVGTAWVFGATIGYFASLGQAVNDAIVFTLPMLLPWAFWVGTAAATIARRIQRATIEEQQRARARAKEQQAKQAASLTPPMHSHSRSRATQPKHPTSSPATHMSRGGTQSQPDMPMPPEKPHRSTAQTNKLALVFLLLLTLAWGYSRWSHSNKADLWLFRTFGEGALEHMEPGAVVIVRWEQGTILQYLRLVEGKRPDVWVDIVEPDDEPWRERAQRRYSGKTVYCIGNAADGATTGAQRVWETDYAILFRL